MKGSGLITILMLSLVFLCATPALAVPPMPSSFYGTVKIDGGNVPAGTVVSARINGVEYATSTYQTYNGNTVYSLDIPGENSDVASIQGGKEGDTVVFFIGTLQASQTGAWHSGTNLELNIRLPIRTTGQFHLIFTLRPSITLTRLLNIHSSKPAPRRRFFC